MDATAEYCTVYVSFSLLFIMKKNWWKKNEKHKAGRGPISGVVSGGGDVSFQNFLGGNGVELSTAIYSQTIGNACNINVDFKAPNLDVEWIDYLSHSPIFFEPNPTFNHNVQYIVQCREFP